MIEKTGGFSIKKEGKKNRLREPLTCTTKQGWPVEGKSALKTGQSPPLAVEKPKGWPQKDGTAEGYRETRSLKRVKGNGHRKI